MKEVTPKSIVVTRLLSFIGGGLILAAAVDMYQERQIMHARMAVVEQTTAQTAQDIQIIKDVLVRSAKQIKYTPEEEQCLAKNIYHEAGVESDVGKVAVGQVTINRLKTGRWGDNLCDVVYAKKQFSWTLSKKLKNEEPKGKLWEDSRRVARKVLAGLRVSTLANSMFYHTDYINTPKWVEPKAKVTQIDQHIFYTKTKFVLKPKKEPKTKTHRRKV